MKKYTSETIEKAKENIPEMLQVLEMYHDQLLFSKSIEFKVVNGILRKMYGEQDSFFEFSERFNF